MTCTYKNANAPGDDFAGAEAEVDQAAGHGVVPAARRCRPIEAGQEPAELLLG